MSEEFTEYAKQIPRIKQLMEDGWELFLVDYVCDEYLLERYKKVKLMSGGVRNKRKVKKVYMRKKETAWFEHLAKHLTFGWRPFPWKEFEKNYAEHEKDLTTAERKPKPNMPALIDENVALRRSEGRNLSREEARWQAAQKPAAKPRNPTKKAAKPKAKKTAAAPKLTASQREYLAIQGFVMVKRGGKYVRITN